MNQEGIRCGFFNSVNNDRKYDAEDMGRLFEGVISDGVFSTVEQKFKVEAVPETMDLLVNNGKAWFYERYFEIYNPITVSIRTTDINPRIDAICICINTNESVRAGSIEVVEGPYGEEPSKPSMPVEDGVYYIPIAWITIGPNDTVSTDLDIVSNVGNSTDPVESYRCPYSEPSLDPRRAVYAYEGESGVDPSINKISVKTVTFNLTNTMQDRGGSVIGRYGSKVLTASDLDLEEIKDGTTLICTIKDIKYNSSGGEISIQNSTFIVNPLLVNKINSQFILNLTAMRLTSISSVEVGYDTPCPVLTATVDVIIIDLEDQNE